MTSKLRDVVLQSLREINPVPMSIFPLILQKSISFRISLWKICLINLKNNVKIRPFEKKRKKNNKQNNNKKIPTGKTLNIMNGIVNVLWTWVCEVGEWAATPFGVEPLCKFFKKYGALHVLSSISQQTFNSFSASLRSKAVLIFFKQCYETIHWTLSVKWEILRG